MFRIFLCFFLLAIFQVIAQEEAILEDKSYERQLNIREFINIKVYSGIEVKLIPGKENKLLISGEDRKDVIAKVKGQTLKIRHSLEHILNPTFKLNFRWQRISEG